MVTLQARNQKKSVRPAEDAETTEANRVVAEDRQQGAVASLFACAVEHSSKVEYLY